MTFSLIGRCARTGQFGAVVTTSSPCVGARVPFLLAKTGAILTQHRTDPRLGPRGLDLLASGCSAKETMAALVASTPDHGWRQLAVIDASGATASFSGAHNKPLVGEAEGLACVAIGNILASTTVPQAMVDVFEAAADLSLAERLILALEAGEAAGGEGRTLRSAALKVVDEEIFPLMDFRIDASDAPIPTLRALWVEYLPQSDLYMERALRPGGL
jgi:uncharacterized Ntn-hydrolase superfamily protein